MKKKSKRLQLIQSKIDKTKIYPVADALPLVKTCASAKFDESVDVAIQLGVDPKKSDQVVRGAVVMPSGVGKVTRIAVFAQGEKAEQAKQAGADIVGMEDLVEQIKAGNIAFDVVVASPDAMRIVGQVATILGPRGLMPNPKTGTVTPNVVQAIEDIKKGQVAFRTDKAGIIHATIGRASFASDALEKNLLAILEALQKAKPVSSKGVYIRRIGISTTMGPSVRLDHQALLASQA
jgi:large subunit ribosomal protein L1